MAALEAGKSKSRQRPHPVGQVDGHAAVEHAHLGQVLLEPLLIARRAVQGRVLLNAVQGHQVVDQAYVGQVVAAQPQEAAGQAVQPERPHRGETVAAEPQIRLLFPAPPEHAQMGVVQFVRQVAHHLFRVKIAEPQPMRRGRTGGDKQRQKMLDDFDRQIAEVFFNAAALGRLKRAAEQAAAQGDVGAVVGQRGGTGVGQDHQVVGDHARLLELGNGVELAARQGPVAEAHVGPFALAPLPARQAGVEEQLAVELVGNQVVEPFLPGRRVRGQVHSAGLAVVPQAEFPIGVVDEQLQQKKAAAGFAGNGAAGQFVVVAAAQGEAGDLGRAVVADQVVHQPFAGSAQERVVATRQFAVIDRVGQGEFQQIADRDPQPGFAFFGKEEPVLVLSGGAVRVGLVGQQIALENGGGVFAQQPAGKAHPGIFPDLLFSLVEEGVEIGEQMGAEVAAPGAQDKVLVGVGLDHGYRQIHVLFGALHRRLKLVLHPHCGVGPGKGAQSGGLEDLPSEQVGAGGKIAGRVLFGARGEGNGHAVAVC